MARGGRVIYKKAATSKNRKARSKRDGDGDEDEEYVVEEGEDEESESNFGSDVNSHDLSDEESFDFCESDRSDDGEEKEIKIAKSKKKRGNRRKSTVSDDEIDADYELDDEEEEKEVEIARSNKKHRNLKKSRFSDDEMDPDYELNDDEEEKEFEIAKSKKRPVNLRPVNRRKSRVSDDEIESDYEFNGEDEDEVVKIVGSKKKQRNKKKSKDSIYEIDSDYEEERKEVKVARSKKQRTLKKYGISDDELDPDYKLDDEVEEREVETGRSKKKSVVSEDEMDSNYELDHEQGDEEFEIEIPKKKQGDRNKNRIFDYEMEDQLIPMGRGRGTPRKKETGDSDYEFDDEDDEKQFSIARSKKNRGNRKKSRVFDDQDEEKELLKKSQGICKKSRVSSDKVKDISVPKKGGKGRPRKHNSRDSDYEFDGEDFEDDDFSPNEDDFDEDEIAIASKRRAKVSKTKRRKKRRQNCAGRSSDDDFIVKDRVSVGRKRKRSQNARKGSSAADLESLDLDFVTSDDDFVEKDIARINSRRKTNKNVTKVSGSRGRRKRRSVWGSESSDSDFVISDDDDVEDDDFNVKAQIVSNKQEVNRKKEVGKSNQRKGRKRSTVDSASSDSDYLISEDDEDFMLAEDHDMHRKKSKKGRKKRSSSSVYRDSESFDFDDAISEEEVRDIRIGGGLDHEKQKKVILGKKVEEKGKEKQADDSGKQVCGVCLSEEKKSVVQGLLNCCTHYFCFACIMEWSKVESRCPLCKRRFATISKLGKSNPGLGFGIRSSVIRVVKRDQVYQPSEGELRSMLDPYENVVCMECQQGGDDNLMLLCDTCDSSAHTYCVGLGREVPEGNWYCECCRSVSEGGPSNSQFQDSMPNHETSSNNLFSGAAERSGFSLNSPRPSSLRIDLNALPGDFPGEDHFVSTPTSGSGASTVSGRRHIRQRIHVILSNNRQRQTDAGATVPASANLNPLPSISSAEQRQRNPWPFFPSQTNLAPSMINEGSSFRHVDHAKEQVQHLVKCHLKNLSQNRILDRSAFKEIARKSTHTILAACGIEHRRNMVSAAIEPPENCAHDSTGGPSHLLKGCCSSCFELFVKDVVQQEIDTA